MAALNGHVKDHGDCVDNVSRTALEYLDKRQDRAEEILDRIVTVQEELSRITAVNSHRLTATSEQIENLAAVQNNTLTTLDNRIDNALVQIDDLKKIIYKYVGGVAIIGFILAYGPALWQLFGQK
jgi:hypothetical protein